VLGIERGNTLIIRESNQARGLSILHIPSFTDKPTAVKNSGLSSISRKHARLSGERETVPHHLREGYDPLRAKAISRKEKRKVNYNGVVTTTNGRKTLRHSKENYSATIRARKRSPLSHACKPLCGAAENKVRRAYTMWNCTALNFSSIGSPTRGFKRVTSLTDGLLLHQ